MTDQTYSEDEMRNGFENSKFYFCGESPAEQRMFWDVWKDSWSLALSSQAEQIRHINKAFEQECADVDKICNALGIESFRTEAGYLQVMRVINYIADGKSAVGNLQSLLRAANEQLTQANTTIAALQARIGEADGQEPRVWMCEATRHIGTAYIYDSKSADACASTGNWKVTPLFTRPSITSERELALLAVIEQMRELLSTMRDKLVPNKPHIDHITINNASGAELVIWCKAVDEALALTPEAALNEVKARVLEDAADKFETPNFKQGYGGSTVANIKMDLRKMASELRQL